MAEKAKKRRKGAKKNIPAGFAHIQATFNNTIITMTDAKGNVICWSSAGCKGFKGTKKGTPFAATIAAGDAAQKAKVQGMRTVGVLVRGPGSGREAAIQAIQAAGLKINMIRDVTPIPHNGCRPPKRRRV